MSDSEMSTPPYGTWECPNGHLQPWPAMVWREGDRPFCNACFNEWAARKFPTTQVKADK